MSDCVVESDFDRDSDVLSDKLRVRTSESDRVAESSRERLLDAESLLLFDDSVLSDVLPEKLRDLNSESERVTDSPCEVLFDNDVELLLVDSKLNDEVTEAV